MSDWIVENRETGEVVYAYTADQADHFDAFPLEIHNHIRKFGEVEVAPPRLISKVEYLRRFSTEERVAIRTAAKQNAVLEDYLSLLELAADIDLDDPDTIGAVHMLESVGLVGAGRAAEVLA